MPKNFVESKRIEKGLLYLHFMNFVTIKNR
jgi:hypothetical protein